MRRLYFTVLNAKTRGFFHSLIPFAAQQLFPSRLFRFNLLMGYFIRFSNLQMYGNSRSLYEHTISSAQQLMSMCIHSDGEETHGMPNDWYTRAT